MATIVKADLVGLHFYHFILFTHTLMSFILDNFTNIWQIVVLQIQVLVFQIASSRPGRLSWVAFVKQLTEMRWKEGQALFSFFSIVYSHYTSATFHSTLVYILPGRWFLFFGQISETADDRDALEGGRGDKQRTTLTTDRPLVHPPYLRAQNESVSKIPTKNTFWRQNEFLPIFGQKVADKHDRRQSLPMLVWSQRLDQITRL